MNEHALILKLNEGDKDAFATLYNLYWAKVYNFTSLYIISDIESEEIVQEVFLRVWEQRELIDENKEISGFLFILTRNLIFNTTRKNLNKSFYKLTVLDALEDESQNVSDKVVYADLLTHIYALIEKLPARQKEVFKMSRDQHMTYREIADQLGITHKTVERHINESLKYLKANLDTTTFLLVLFTMKL